VTVLKIGTRGSALALWQARALAAALEPLGVRVELVTIATRGDRTQDVPLAALGGKGVFVKEIHEALLRREIDLAVHSAKDMAATPPDGVTIGAALPREDPRDALVLPGATRPGSHAHIVALLGATPVIGTGSPRRIAQLRRIFPAARFEPIRGNVDTRLRKLDGGEVDALVLACAGLRRLGLSERITAALPTVDCVPAPGQGIIAVEARADDGATNELLARISDRLARTALAAEQAVVAELGGGCQLPLGALAEIQDQVLVIRAVVASSRGTEVIASDITGDPNDPVKAGTRLARELASRGARELLNS
jgi:hydroxymethylbilane synthase